MDETPTTILVVEDERDLADLYSAWLAPTYDVRTAYSGEEALELFDTTVDAVLLDRNLPGIYGDDVLLEIRSQTDTPVAFVSGVDPAPDILHLDVDLYRRKPIMKEMLEETVEELLYLAALDEVSRQALALTDKLEQLGATVPDLVPDLDDVDTMLDTVETLRQLRRAVTMVFPLTDD
jgi:DNA-binding response OmpR family regulator